MGSTRPLSRNTSCLGICPNIGSQGPCLSLSWPCWKVTGWVLCSSETGTKATSKDGICGAKALSNSTMFSVHEPMAFSGPLLVARMKIKTQRPPQEGLKMALGRTFETAFKFFTLFLKKGFIYLHIYNMYVPSEFMCPTSRQEPTDTRRVLDPLKCQLQVL